MAHSFLRDLEADGWERSDFPIICESCLGDNPDVRVTKADYDEQCKICTRPFPMFWWSPGCDARFKKTEVCQTCIKLKNVCQVCLLDLEYGLPVHVRDTALAIDSNDSIPKSHVNREYFAEEHDLRARAGIDYESSFGKARSKDTILKLQRTTPYCKRNRAHVCSFFIRGECTRGAECPYRHEMPITGELSQQNIKDRYYGVNDPVAAKLLNKAGEMPSQQQNQVQPPWVQDQPSAPMSYFNIPPPPQPERAYYPSMDPQRMGAVVPSQECSSSGSSESQQGTHYPYQRPPLQGHYPPYGYMAPPPPYQQYSHQPLSPQPPPPMGAQPRPPFHQQPSGAPQPQPHFSSNHLEQHSLNLHMSSTPQVHRGRPVTGFLLFSLL